jgi:hypothetical protein
MIVPENHALLILLANSPNKELMRFIRPNLKNLRAETEFANSIIVAESLRTCDLLVRSPVGPSSANSHLTTSTNIFNELQPQASALIYTEIGLFPARIVTRLSQANAWKPEPLPLVTAFRHLFQEQFRLKPILVRRIRRHDSFVFRKLLFALRRRRQHLTKEP